MSTGVAELSAGAVRLYERENSSCRSSRSNPAVSESVAFELMFFQRRMRFSRISSEDARLAVSGSVML